MHLIAFIEYCAIVAGVAAIVAGKYFSLHKGVELGYFLIGASFLLAGLTSVYTRQTSSPFSGSGRHNGTGVRAIIVGMMQILAGSALIGSAYALSGGHWLTVVNFISARPGPVLAAIGLTLTGAGLLLIIGAGRNGSVLRFFLAGIPRMFIGVIVLTFGIATAGAGAWEWFDHRGFESFANGVAAKLNLPEPAPLWRKAVSSLR